MVKMVGAARKNLSYLLLQKLSIIFVVLPVVWGADHYLDHVRKLQEFRASIITRRDSVPSPVFAPASGPAPPPLVPPSPRVYLPASYGADPTGKSDSTEALLKALSDAFNGPADGFLMDGISNLGGARVDLQGGIYLISKPLRLPDTGAGNLLIHGGTLRASDDFATDGYLIDLSSSTSSTSAATSEDSKVSSSSSYNYDFISLRDLMLDANYRGGGVAVINSLRTTIDNCFIAHFTTDGILVKSGHETYIRNSYLGQHITAGGDSGERNFSGTAINLIGNDNAVTDVVIFSAAVGIMVAGQANTLTGVHCYNKATGFGGTGIYLKLPGLTQTRILNCYMDYTGIVAEDPVQLQISGCFFLGDAFVLLKSVKGVINGVNIVDNMFTGYNKGIEIVQLDQSSAPFNNIDQVVVERNSVRGMQLKTTVARAASKGNSTTSTWAFDFSPLLLFPNLIKHVQYSFVADSADAFPAVVLRNVSDNRVVVQSNVAVQADVYVTVHQSGGDMN